jgi:hypothetical protein
MDEYATKGNTSKETAPKSIIKTEKRKQTQWTSGALWDV